MPKLRLVAISDRPFVRDYTHYWRLPPPLPKGEAYYSGLNGLLAVLALIGLSTCIGTMS
jgi:hypothetical protein